MKFLPVGVRTFHTLRTKTNEELRDFVKVFPQIVRDLTELDEFSDIPQANKWLSRVLSYNVPHGTQSKSMIVPLCYKSLEGPDKFTPENRNLSNILGWCFELNQVALLMQDDIMDGDVTRRKKPCWHKLEDVGMRAVNDSLLLEVGVYKLLRKHFFQDPSYVKYLELFLGCTFACGMGQTMEAVANKEGKSNINAYTFGRFKTIAKYKSEHYSFLFPVTFAMHLAKKFDPAIYGLVKPFLEELGWLVQVENDAIEICGDPLYTGKAETDIERGVCTWVICVAVERANLVQKSLLRANYGKDDPYAIQTVKQVFNELDIKGAYEEQEARKLESLRKYLGQISKGFPHESFLGFLEGLVVDRNWKETQWWFS